MSRILSPRVLLTIVVVLGVMIASRILLPVALPGIQLPAEPVRITDNVSLPNTLIATLITDITLLIIAFLATRNMQLVPSGIQNVVEAIIEWIYNLAQDLAGHNAKKFFPWAMTIFLLILVSNWWELIPGVDSIGWLESHTALTAHDETSPGGEEILQEELLNHYRVEQPVPGIAYITDANEPYKPTPHEYEVAHENHTVAIREETGEPYAVLVPFIRAATTDLNLTLALAIITMVMVQVYGFQALGAGYLTKFFNFKGGPVGIFVGLIELISEFAKIISFGFRLFGNIFAGQVLLFVMSFLVPWLLPLPFYGLETFVGFIQAVVFAGLALIFMQGATESHDAEHH